MSAPRQRGSRACLLVICLLLSGLVLPLLGVSGLVVAASPAQAATALPVEVSLDVMTPTLVTPQTGLEIAGRLRNLGPDQLRSVAVTLRTDGQRLTSGSEVAAWASAAPTSNAGRNIPGTRVELDQPLDSGDSAPFRISAPGATLARLFTDGFGPRGLAVAVTSVGGTGERRSGLVRTFVVWKGEAAPMPAPADLTVVVPLEAGTPQNNIADPDPRLVEALEPGGRLFALLEATRDVRVTWLVDPAVVDAAGQVDPSPAAAAPSATQTAAQDAQSSDATWLQAFTQGAQGREVVALPWGDPDLAAMARTALLGAREAALVESMLTMSSAWARDRMEDVLGRPTRLVARPANDLADEAAAALIRRQVSDSALLSAGSLQVTAGSGARQDGAPLLTGPAQVSTPDGPLTGLPVDATASASLAGMSGGPGGTAGAVNSVLAVVAAAALESAADPGPDEASDTMADPGQVVAVGPRGWDADAAALRSALLTLSGAPWVRMSDLAGVAAGPATPAGVEYPRAAARRELPTEHVASVAGVTQRAQAFAPAVPGGREVVRPFEQRGLSLVGTAWRSAREEELARARIRLGKDVQSAYAAVTIVPGSQILLVATSAQIPVRVSNDLPEAVRVQVRLRPLSGQLTAAQPVVVDVPAGSDATARVPVRTVANGDVEVFATLHVPDGPIMGPPVTLDLRVRRDWESRGLAVGAGALALLFVIGLTRSMRRQRVRLRPEDAPDFDVIAAAEEERRSRGEQVLTPARPAPVSEQPEQPKRPEQPEQPQAGTSSELHVDVARSSAVMAAGTLLSRILGFVRTAMLGAAIGVESASADAFGVANTVPNIIYMLLAGSVLNAVLVPQITRAARQGEAGRIFVDKLVTVSTAVIAAVTAAVTVAAPLIVDLYTSGSVSAQQLALSTAFAFWCLPQVLFYGLYMVWGQILTARGHFAAFTWAPVVNNVVAITGLATFIVVEGSGGKGADGWTAGAIALLAGSATLGVAAQAFILVPYLRRVGYTFRPRWGLRGAGLRRASTVAAWTFAAVVMTQLAFIVTSRVLTAAGEASRATDASIASGLAIYSFAYLLFMLPHSIITVSLVTALFTRMSDAAGRGDTAAVRDDLSLGLRLTCLVTIPSATFMLAAGPLVASVIFPANTAAETRGIGLGAAAMMLGLASYSAQYLLHRVFYSYEDARTPFFAQAPAVVISIVGALIVSALAPAAWVVVGIGLVMTTANTVGMILAALALRPRLHNLDGARVTRVVVRVVLAATAAAAGAWVVRRVSQAGLAFLGAGGLTARVVVLAVTVAAMGGLYWVGLRALRVAELDALLGPVVSRLRRR